MAEVLQEFVDSRGVAMSVDRNLGVLRGVKLIGLESRNGRRYRESALEQAKSLYEEAKVNVNHPKDGPLAPRDYQDRLGVIRGVELRSGEGLFGDLHFNPKHPLAEQLAWDSEHNPRNVGFSHNVLARLSRKGQMTVVDEITRVQSVDLVADPAATLGLYEHAEQTLCWDALTVESLELYRPDLVEEMRSAVKRFLQKELEEANRVVATLQRRQRVVELLCEHQLLIAVDGKENHDHADTGRQEVSLAFFEMLTKVESDKEVRQLIVERAELVRSAPSWQSSLVLETPRSRDQIAVHALGSAGTANAEEFAKAINSVST